MHSFNNHEQEVIVLNAICGLIDEMVNYEMFAEQWSPDWSNILFRTSTHTRLFNILLVDFLSLPNRIKGGKLPFGLERPPNAVLPSDKSYLVMLKKIIEAPLFSTSTEELGSAVVNFAKWLDGKTVIENVWFSSLDLEIDMTINRVEALKMTGNIGKHNFTRLSSVAESLKDALSTNGSEKEIEECYLALPEFQEWFHDHAFVYQSSQIAEFLNELRWAIYNYLRPELQRSYRSTFNADLQMKTYSYDVPNTIEHTFARAMYWDLMNLTLRGPQVPKFTVNKSFKSALSPKKA